MPPSLTHTHVHIRRHCSPHCFLFGESAPDVTDKRSSACYMPRARCVIIVGRADSAALTIHQNTPMLCIFGRNKSTDISILPSAGRLKVVRLSRRLFIAFVSLLTDAELSWIAQSRGNVPVFEVISCDLNIPTMEMLFCSFLFCRKSQTLGYLVSLESID